MNYLNDFLPKELCYIINEYAYTTITKYIEKEYKIRIESFTNIHDFFYDLLLKSFIEFKGFDININDIKIKEDNKLLLFQLFNYEDSKIIISYEYEAIIFITDSNWNKYKKEYNYYKKIIFIGPVETIGDNWLYCSKKLENVYFLHLYNLKYIGDYWLSFCRKLNTVNFIGLPNLVYVGYNWLNSSNKLAIFDFSVLTSISINYHYHRSININNN
jgi:hypothetical protein